jgi:D-alanyl-D-alanine carboxypeptidase
MQNYAKENGLTHTTLLDFKGFADNISTAKDLIKLIKLVY